MDMTYSKYVEKFLEDAKAAGYTVDHKGGHGNRVHVWRGRTYSRVRQGKEQVTKTLINCGVCLFLTAEGSFYEAIRLDVPVEIALKVKTLKDCRSILGLSK